jgi:hypothetical protein
MAADFNNGKHELHQLIDQLPAEQITAALGYLHYLCADPVLLSLLNAPPDDDPIPTNNAIGMRKLRLQS